MEKKLWSLLFVIILLIYVKPIWAFEPFIKNINNPLSFSGNLPNREEFGELQPSVLYESSVYKMWYTSIGQTDFQIAYATSTDGTSWVRQAVLPLEQGVENQEASILRDSDGLILFYAVSNNGVNYHISKVKLVDETHPDPSTMKVILTPQIHEINLGRFLLSPMYNRRRPLQEEQ